MAKHLLLLIPAALISFGPSLAAAQTFSTDRMRNQTELGVRMDFGFPRDEGRDVTTDETFFRTEIHGQFAVGGWGGYVSLPLARNMVSGPSLEGEEVTTLGNLELGGFKSLEFGAMDLIVRFGVALPTSDDTMRGFSTNAFSNFGRVTDHINTQPNIFGIRLSASPMFSAGVFFIKADLGFDMLWDTAGQDAGETAEAVFHDDFQSFFRGNVSMGANIGIVTLAIESVNMMTLADSSFAFGAAALDKSIHTVTAGVWANLGYISPYLAATVPVDELSRDNYGFVFTVGADVRL
jgi:hypothetical protein